MKLTACLLVAGMTVSATDSVAFAAKGSSLAGLGAERSEETELQTETAVQSVDGQAAESETQAETAQQTEAAEETAAQTEAETQTQEETVAETEATLDTSMNGQLAFAQCDEYINVRSEASADSEVVGKVYNNGSVTILGQIGDWYQVQSGNATGYVNAEYFATGEEAQAIAEEVAYNVATVYPEALTVRSEPSEDSEPIGTVYSTDELEVVQYDGDWMKVALGNDVYGYVSAYYVGYDTYYATAETLDEEQARLDQEWLDYLAESEAEEERLNQQWQDYLDQQAADQAAADQAYQDQLAAEQAAADAQAQADAASQQTSDAQSQAEQAYQEYLDAQAAADAAAQQGDEQNVYDTAAAAQQQYQDYLNAQAAADAQAQAEADAAAQAAQAAADAEAAAQQAQQAQTEAPQTEAPQTEAPQETAPETEAPSYSSSTGSQIVNFATQFVGNPYVWGGTSLTNGADCSGFTQSVFANFGISIPRTAAAQASSGTPVSLSDIQAGDLLFYSNGSGIGHVTIYMGNGQVVHASNSNTGITISDYGYRTPVSARRYW